MNTENCGNACAHSETVTAPSLPGLIVTRVDSAAAPPRRKRRRASSLLASAEFSDVAVQASPHLPGTSSCGCLSVIPALLRFVLDLPGYRIAVVEATGRLSERSSVRPPVRSASRPLIPQCAAQTAQAAPGALSGSPLPREMARIVRWTPQNPGKAKIADSRVAAAATGATRRGGLKVGREVGVDLATAGDLNELGGLPLHASFLRSIDPVAPSPGRRRLERDIGSCPASAPIVSFC